MILYHILQWLLESVGYIELCLRRYTLNILLDGPPVQPVPPTVATRELASRNVLEATL